MAVFPNFGAISANIVNAQNNKRNSVIYGNGSRPPTKKDLFIGFLILLTTSVVSVIFALLLCLIML